MLDQPAHEILAARDLFQGNELVGLVRLRDMARAADHGGDVGLVEQPRLGPEAHLAPNRCCG